MKLARNAQPRPLEYLGAAAYGRKDRDPLDGAAKLENGNLGARIETNAQQMAYAAADVHVAVAGKCESSGGIAFVAYRQKRWWQEWWFALAPVGVARKNPALITGPYRAVGTVRIVGEHDGRGVAASLSEYADGIESRAPQIVESQKLQARDGMCLVSEHFDARFRRDCRNLLRHIRHPPAESIVVVSKNPQCSEAAVRRVRDDAPQLFELARATIGDPVSREGDEVGCELLNSPEGPKNVIIVDSWTDVQVAQLCESAALKFARKPGDRQHRIGELQPVRLDAPSVQPQ
jgi:hypothetical protein